jgi:hypothetical protein
MTGTVELHLPQAKSLRRSFRKLGDTALAGHGGRQRRHHPGLSPCFLLRWRELISVYSSRHQLDPV